MDKKPRNVWIDFCRGILIVLVIIGHFCIKLITQTDVQLEVCNVISYFIYSFHMPALFLLSGYVFRIFIAPGVYLISFGQFVTDKAISYGIPYAIFSIIYGTMKFIGNEYAINPINENLLLFPIKPMGYLWFLYALSLFNILAYIIEKLRIDRYLFVGIFAVLFIFSTFINTSWFGFFRVCRFGLFFAIGSGFAHELVEDYRAKKRILFIASISFIALEGFYIYRLFKNSKLLLPFDEEPQYLLLWLILAIGGAYICVSICKEYGQHISEKNWISYAGRNSIILYLTHQIAISVLRAILIGLHITGVHFQILFTLGGSMLIGLVVIKLAERFKIIGAIFYPKKYIVTSATK